MAQYPKPSSTSGTFNNTSFNNNQTGGLTIAEGLKYFVSYPKTQSPSTITANNFTTTGNLDVAGDSQFGGDVEFLGGVIISGGIVFSDDVEVQGTTTLDDTVLCLQTVEIDGELTVNNNILLNPSLTAPTVAPYIELTNGVAGEYCQLYLDPQTGYDMTLYSAQGNKGGLTVRSSNGASYTINPTTLSPGVVGAQLLNPLDMNGNNLLGLENLLTVSNVMNFQDYTTEPLLQLSNSGHISYFNLNMNNNDISKVNIVSFGGNNCSISAQSDFNPNILTISNTSPYANNGQIYFQMLNSGGTAYSPMSITSSGIYYSTNLNLAGYNINGIGAISGNGASSISCLSNVSLNNNTLSNVNVLGTTATQPLGTNNTSLASTAFVIANLPSTSNFAQLITGSTQTFTGPVNFTGGLNKNGAGVATISQLPIFTTSTLSILAGGACSLNSGSFQQTIQTTSTSSLASVGTFLSYPFTFTINSYVAVGALLCNVIITPSPYPAFPPSNLNFTITGTTSTGLSQPVTGTFGLSGGNAYIALYMPYNFGTGSVITMNFASLGQLIG